MLCDPGSELLLFQLLIRRLIRRNDPVMVFRLHHSVHFGIYLLRLYLYQWRQLVGQVLVQGVFACGLLLFLAEFVEFIPQINLNGLFEPLFIVTHFPLRFPLLDLWVKCLTFHRLRTDLRQAIEVLKQIPWHRRTRKLRLFRLFLQSAPGSLMQGRWRLLGIATCV